MKNNYNRLFKFSASKNNPLSYTVYRRNFSEKFIKVADATIIPGERLEINYSKILKGKEKTYVEDYFKTLVNLKIEPSKSSKFHYNVFRKTNSEVSERVAIVILTSTGYDITCIKDLNATETSYLENYIQYLVKNKTIK